MEESVAADIEKHGKMVDGEFNNVHGLDLLEYMLSRGCMVRQRRWTLTLVVKGIIKVVVHSRGKPQTVGVSGTPSLTCFVPIYSISKLKY